MSAEIKDQTELLQTQLDKSKTLFESRSLLYKRIGTDIPDEKGRVPVIKEDTNPLKVALAKDAVERSQLRILEKIERLEIKLSDLKLIDLAEKYVQSLDQKRTELDNLQRLRRHLSPQVVANHEESFNIFRDRPKYEEDLKKGLQLLALQKEQEAEIKRQDEERQKMPMITINSTTGKVSTRIVDDHREAVFTEGDIRVLTLLAAESGNLISAPTLGRRLRELNLITTTQNPSQVITRLRRNLEPNPKTPQVILSSGRSISMCYRLRGQVEFIEVQEQNTDLETVKNKGLKSVPRSRLEALRAIIDLPETNLSTVISLLGSDKNNRPLHWATALYAMRNAINKLYMRIAHQTVTPEEFTVWQVMQKLANEQKNERVVGKTKVWVETWFKDRKPIKMEKKGLIEIGQERLEALHLIMNNPGATIKEIISALPKTKKGKDFTPQQAKVSLVNTIRRVYARVLRGTITPAEQQLWEEIKIFVEGEYSNEKTKIVASEKLKESFKERPVG